jgi:hypothetical protein
VYTCTRHALTSMHACILQARDTSSFTIRGVKGDCVQRLRARGVGMWTAAEARDLDRVVQDIMWEEESSHLQDSIQEH